MICNGTQSCRGTTMTNIRNSVTAIGTNSLQDTMIYSAAGENVFNVDLYDTPAESDTFGIVCSESRICRIYCHSQDSCTNLYLYCYGLCYVSCDDININCPFYGSYILWATNQPTMDPSNKPSYIPSYIPSYDPSKAPSNIPSIEPSQTPSIVSSNMPRISTSSINVVQTTKTESSNNSNTTGGELESSDLVLIVLIVCVTIILMLIMILSYKYKTSGRQQGNNNVELTPIISTKIENENNSDSNRLDRQPPMKQKKVMMDWQHIKVSECKLNMITPFCFCFCFLNAY